MSDKKPMAVSRVSVLSQLHQYSNSEAREQGTDACRSCLWQLTKARRVNNRGIMSVESGYRAEDIREDLRATALVQVEGGEPDLVDDDQPETPGVPPTFTLLDAMEVMKKQKQDCKEDDEPKNASGGGLRQRKNNNDGKPQQQRTMVEEADVEELHDPLELFGALPPRELKEAQKHAKIALAAYVQSANEAAKLLSMLKRAQ
jgi:hypothetical protein